MASGRLKRHVCKRGQADKDASVLCTRVCCVRICADVGFMTPKHSLLLNINLTLHKDVCAHTCVCVCTDGH